MSDQLYYFEEVEIDRTGVGGTCIVRDGEGETIFTINREDMADAGIESAIKLANWAYQVGLHTGRRRLQGELRHILMVPSKQDLEGLIDD